MDKLANVNVCLTCVNVLLRNFRSVHLTEKRCSLSSEKTGLLLGISFCPRQLVRLYSTITPKSQPLPRQSDRLYSTITPEFHSPPRQSVRLYSTITPEFHSPPRQSVRLYSTITPEPQPPPRPSSKQDPGKSPISWKNLLVVAGIGCAIVLGLEYLKREKDIKRNQARSRLLGKAKLGGDWTLTDHHGNRRSSSDFRGQWLLIYFGFTHCPDVCPEEIEKIVGVINKTDGTKDLPKIQPIVITVDPERDTPQALKEYCTEFSPRLLGFTGSSEEIQQATHAYRVYFSAGPKDGDSDYIVDHSIISYLINPDGQFVDYYGQNKTVNEMYTSIQLHIGSYLKRQKSETAKST